jgi:hypothetical protein
LTGRLYWLLGGASRASEIDPDMPIPPGNHIEGEYVVADGYHVIRETRTFDIARDDDMVRIKELTADGCWAPLLSFPFTWVAGQS